MHETDIIVGRDQPRTTRFRSDEQSRFDLERDMNFQINEQRVLLAPGDAILPGDEIWDSDFETWQKATPGMCNRTINSQDIVARRSFDLKPLLHALTVQVDKLRDGSPPDAGWWQIMDGIVAESKRRMGMKSFASYDQKTGLANPTVSEAPKPIIGEAMADEVKDFKRRRKIRLQ